MELVLLMRLNRIAIPVMQEALCVYTLDDNVI